MNIFKKIFGGSRNSGGSNSNANELVLGFLKSSRGHKSSVYTYTELFAFIYFEIDSVLSARRMLCRQSFVQSLSEIYSDTLVSRFNINDVDKHISILNSRIKEYAEGHNSGKEKSEIIDGLGFYLDQASLKNDYQVLGSPVMLGGNPMNMIMAKQELSNFYIKSLAPFIQRLISANE